MTHSPMAASFVLLVASAFASAQDRDTVADRIREIAFTTSEAEAALFELCDRVGPRLTGSESYERAAAWMRASLERHGVEISVERSAIANRWQRGPATVRIVAPIQRELAAVAGGWAPPTEGTVAVGLVVDRAAEIDDEAVAGLAVLVDPTLHPLRPGASAPFATAAVCLVDAQRAHGLLPGGVATWAPPFVPGAVPTAFVAANDAALLRRLAASSDVRVEVTIGGSLAAGGDVPDVIADLLGASDEIVFAVARLDSWDLGAGAVDDAAGCVVMLEAARILAALDRKPARTIRFVFLAGVAQGLGSANYVRRRDGRELARHVFGFAMPAGGGRLLGLALAGRADLLESAREWFAPVADLGVTDIGLRSPRDNLADALVAAGVPVVTFVNESPELATVGSTRVDTPDRVLDIDLRQAACVLATGLWRRASIE